MNVSFRERRNGTFDPLRTFAIPKSGRAEITEIRGNSSQVNSAKKIDRIERRKLGSTSPTQNSCTDASSPPARCFSVTAATEHLNFYQIDHRFRR